MSLDQNLFTLVFTQNKDHPNVTDLVDPSGTVHYHKRKVPGSEYKIEVYDPLSQAHLITASAPSATSKTKTLELHNPTILVDLKHTGSLSFRWSFKWEQHEFEWKRTECFLIRKPDPPVLVAITKEPTGRVKTLQVQILDYNINRFEVEDRKGLEIVLLTALMTFHDHNEAAHEIPSTPIVEHSTSRKFSLLPTASSAPDTPPAPPPKPAPKTGIDRIAEKQAQGGDYNEIIVDEEGSIQDYAAYCNTLLQDDAMLFVTVKSSTALAVPKVLQVVEEAKRLRYKAGLDEESEIHQYVLYETEEKKKGPRRIILDDEADQKNKYAPPTSLSVHLSKIPMPELQPKSTPSNDKGKKKESKKARASPPPVMPSPSIPASAATSRPSSSFEQKGKQPKNKLTRPPKDKDKESKIQSQPPSLPPTGLFNAVPDQPTPSVSPKPPRSSIAKEGGYETPGLSLYSSFIPPRPTASAGHLYRPNTGTKHPPPPPPPPVNVHEQGGSARPLSMTTMATSVAQNVVTGLFDKLNHRRH